MDSPRPPGRRPPATHYRSFANDLPADPDDSFGGQGLWNPGTDSVASIDVVEAKPKAETRAEAGAESTDPRPETPGRSTAGDEAPSTSAEPTEPQAPPTPERLPLLRARRKQAMETSLLLASQSIPHWLEEEEGRTGHLVIWVPTELHSAALPLLRHWRRENRSFLKSLKALPLPPLTLAPLYLLAIPTAIHIGIHATGVSHTWALAGIADAELILRGEWWRCFTALTLHADNTHLLSNLASGFFLLHLLQARSQWVWAAWGITLAGIAGNFANALYYGSDHRSLGFSTAVFAALGILAVLELRGRRTGGLHGLAPLGGALSVAVMLGIGDENTDVGAHFFGLLAGLLLGLLPTLLPAPLKEAALRKPALVAAALGLPLAYAAVWWIAL